MIQTLVEKMKSLDSEISRFKLLNVTLKDNIKNVEQVIRGLIGKQ